MQRIRARISARARAGFSLIEVMVAMTMLSLVMLQLAKVTTSVALKNRTQDLVTKRGASLQLEANKFGAVPFSRLASWSTANQTITRGNFTYTRQLTISRQSSNRYSIKIIVIPTADSSRKDSVMIDRTQPPQSALCAAGC
jgi:prepilin-type N-terminal cleavage/methylation domain-containing protein